MLGEDSDSANYWKKCGDQALRHDVRHIVIMVSHIAMHRRNTSDLVCDREHTGPLSTMRFKSP